jgi:hypothetical protein
MGHSEGKGQLDRRRSRFMSLKEVRHEGVYWIAPSDGVCCEGIAKYHNRRNILSLDRELLASLV